MPGREDPDVKRPADEETRHRRRGGLRDHEGGEPRKGTSYREDNLFEAEEGLLETSLLRENVRPHVVAVGEIRIEAKSAGDLLEGCFVIPLRSQARGKSRATVCVLQFSARASRNASAARSKRDCATRARPRS
jgi:hypothetical protein